MSQLDSTNEMLNDDQVLFPTEEELLAQVEGIEQLEEGMTQEEATSFEETFREHVEKCKNLIQNDQEKYYQCIAEIHVLLMMFEASMRSMMMNGGPKTILRMMMGRK